MIRQRIAVPALSEWALSCPRPSAPRPRRTLPGVVLTEGINVSKRTSAGCDPAPLPVIIRKE